MKAIELSGLHVDSLLVASWTVTNKDGRPRANAKPKTWYVIPKTIMHKQDGSVKITGSWFTSKPVRVRRRDTSGNMVLKWNEYRSVGTHPDHMPYHAEVTVVNINE